MTARHAAAALALVAVVLLAIGEFTTVLEVTVGSLEVVKRSVTGGANHGYALLVIAALAAAMTPLALRGLRAPAAALAVLGAAALAIVLAVDLPATRDSAGLPESLAYENARARAGPGLRLAIIGGVMLIVAGVISVFAPGGRAADGGGSPGTGSGAPPAA